MKNSLTTEKRQIKKDLLLFLISLGLAAFSLIPFFSLLMPGLREVNSATNYSYSLNDITFGSEIFKTNPILILGYFSLLFGVFFLVFKAKPFKYIIASVFYLASLIIFSCLIPFSELIQGISHHNLTFAFGPIFVIVFDFLSFLGSIGLFVLSRLLLVQDKN